MPSPSESWTFGRYSSMSIRNCRARPRAATKLVIVLMFITYLPADCRRRASAVDIAPQPRLKHGLPVNGTRGKSIFRNSA